MDTKPPVIDVVAGVILDSKGQILACQRPAGKHMAGKWEFPGGKVESGESPDTALVRELQEELQVTVSITGALSIVPWDYGSVRIRLIPLLCEIESGDPRPTEHTQIRWIQPELHPSLEWADADYPILKEILSLSS